MVDTLPALLTPHELAELQRQVLAVHTSDALLNYVQDLVDATRSGKWFLQGLSPRAGIALMRAAKAQALISGRDYVAPDDVQAVLPQTIAHRLVPVGDAGRGAVEQVRAMVDAVPLARWPPPPLPLSTGLAGTLVARRRTAGGAFARGGRGASNAPTPLS